MHMDIWKARFEQVYGEGGEIRLFFAPGQVNLIGDHIDYNGGHVLPCALSLGAYAAVREREDGLVRLASAQEEGSPVYEFTVNSLEPEVGEAHWTRYPRGVFCSMARDGYEIPRGVEILYDMNLPIRAGLGSSAAVCVVTAVLLRDLFWGPDLHSIDLARTAMRAENEYASFFGGIADPFASAMGVRDHAVFLTVNTLRYECVPLPFDSVDLVIADSRVRCSESGDEYDTRRRECERALKKLQTVANIRYLGDLSTDRFESCKDVIMSRTNTKRARHAVYENARTIRAVSALRVKNLARFGELMKQSHISLRDDYEVSCPELDYLAETAWELPGVIGSRMTGRGLGGCTVSIVERSRTASFMETLGDAYRKKFGLEARFYIAEIGDGAREITA